MNDTCRRALVPWGRLPALVLTPPVSSSRGLDANKRLMFGPAPAPRLLLVSAQAAISLTTHPAFSEEGVSLQTGTPGEEAHLPGLRNSSCYCVSIPGKLRLWQERAFER